MPERMSDRMSEYIYIYAIYTSRWSVRKLCQNMKCVKVGITWILEESKLLCIVHIYMYPGIWILVQFSIVKWNGAQNCVEYAQRLGSWATGLESKSFYLFYGIFGGGKWESIDQSKPGWYFTYHHLGYDHKSRLCIVLRSWLISWSKVTMMKHIGVCSLRLKVYFSAVVTHPTEATFNWATLRCCWEPSFEALSRRMAVPGPLDPIRFFLRLVSFIFRVPVSLLCSFFFSSQKSHIQDSCFSSLWTGWCNPSVPHAPT